MTKTKKAEKKVEKKEPVIPEEWDDLLRFTVRRDMSTIELWKLTAEKLKTEFPDMETVSRYKSLIIDTIVEAFPEEDIAIYNLVVKPAKYTAGFNHYQRVVRRADNYYKTLVSYMFPPKLKEMSAAQRNHYFINNMLTADEEAAFLEVLDDAKASTVAPKRNAKLEEQMEAKKKAREEKANSSKGNCKHCPMCKGQGVISSVLKIPVTDTTVDDTEPEPESDGDNTQIGMTLYFVIYILMI